MAYAEIVKLGWEDAVVPSQTIAPGSSETYRISAPPGRVVQVVGVNFSYAAPVGATTGTHLVSISVKDSSVASLEYQTAYLEYPFGSAAGVVGAQPLEGATGVGSFPRDAAPAGSAIQGIHLFGSLELAATYTNNTDVAQTGGRFLIAHLVVID